MASGAAAKLCINCKHLLKSTGSRERSICALFYSLSLVTGEKRNVEAAKARECETMCGMAAKSFNAKVYPVIYD